MRFRLTLVAVLAAFAAACSSAPSVTGPSVMARPSSAHVTFEDYPVVPGISCPSAPPQFVASWDASNTTDLTIKVEWQKMPQAEFIRVYVSRRDVNNVFQPQAYSPVVLGENGETYGQFGVGDEGVYALQVATVTCGAQQNLSDVVIVVVGQGTPGRPTPPVPPTEPPYVPPTPPGPPACISQCDEDTPFVVQTYVSYWRMRQGNTNAKRNACENHGGVWLGDYNIPGDFLFFERDDVCRITGTSNNAHTVTPTGNASDLYAPPGFVVQ